MNWKYFMVHSKVISYLCKCLLNHNYFTYSYIGNLDNLCSMNEWMFFFVVLFASWRFGRPKTGTPPKAVRLLNLRAVSKITNV